MLVTFIAAVALDTPRIQNGTAWSGVETMRFYSREAQIDETHKLKLNFAVTGQENKMWVVSRESRLISTKIDDTELPAPADAYPDRAKEWLSPAGNLLDMDPFDRGVFGLDRLLHFWLPANLPDLWNVQLTSALTNVHSKARAELKLTGQNTGTREYSISFNPIDDPSDISATGKLLFDVRTGRLLRAKLEAKRATLPGGTERANVTLTYLDSQMTKPQE